MGCCSSSSKPVGKGNRPRKQSASSASDSDKLMVTNEMIVTRRKRPLADRYAELEVIGQGATGDVRLAKDLVSAEMRVIKFVDKKECGEIVTRDKVLNEADVLRELDHPNIVRLYEFSESATHHYLILDHCAGGELLHRLNAKNSKRFDEKTAARVLRQILSAVSYCHSRGIMHRDIKLENVMFETEAETSPIIVIDFGTAIRFSQGVRLTQCFGTPEYMAPEVVKKGYDEKCDVWSCGIILYMLLSGTAPFKARSMEETMVKIERGKYVLEGDKWAAVSLPAKALIRRLLEYNPIRRVSAAEALNDPWLLLYPEPKPQPSSFSMTPRDSSELKSAFIRYVWYHMLPEKEKVRCKEEFMRMDTNGDGVVDIEEFNNAGARVKTADIGGERAVEFSEFAEMCPRGSGSAYNEVELHEAFEFFAKDGFITAESLQGIFERSNNAESCQKKLPRLVKDLSADGKIAFPAFKSAVLSRRGEQVY